ncbi:MAG TPA: DegT/DnrJ/EryC1/StrS family aminotransferase [Terriglobales bacterium]|nr:DegT/DnrJ/EryC1/StrS family aminotransferase [Terriglobales bacterium]
MPFFRPMLGEEEIEEVVATLRSGWLTTGAKVRRFEEEFAAAVGAAHCVALNSCTAALHLAVEALGVQPGQAVLVPTMTFAATAEVIRYKGGVPLLVDCDSQTANMSLADAACKLESGLPTCVQSPPKRPKVVGMIPVHVGGLMMDMDAIHKFARRRDFWVVEDAAHAFPAAWRPQGESEWQRCGEGTAAVTCFSFYANKTITTGEGGMAATGDSDLAERMRMLSLHGLSHDAWGRYSGSGKWDYRIMAPGFKYNLTDLAASIGLHQLGRAEQMRLARERIAKFYLETLADVEAIELPPRDADRIHSWHLFPIKLRLERLAIDRNQFIEKLQLAGIGFSVHWRPLHLHPYYAETFGWRPEQFPVATALWERLISLPIFPAMTESEMECVASTVREICEENRR